MDEIVCDVKTAFPGIRLGIHCHNDQGLAVANSLQAVRSGADVIQVKTVVVAFFTANIVLTRLPGNIQNGAAGTLYVCHCPLLYLAILHSNFLNRNNLCLSLFLYLAIRYKEIFLLM